MNYDLVFEGGGAKGMMFVGAMEGFGQRGHTFNGSWGPRLGQVS